MRISKSSNLTIFPILLVNFIGTLGYSIILPFLIIIVTKFGGNEFIYGIMGASYSFFQLIGAPLLGKWSDIFGRKKILLLSQIGTFLAWVLFIIALSIPNSLLFEFDSSLVGMFILTIPLLILFLARALDGITGGNVSVANAYLADVSTDENRKSNFGKMAASANMGFIIGPALAGTLGATLLGELLPVAMAMLISLIAIFVIAFIMPESNPCALSKYIDNKNVTKVLGAELKECYSLSDTRKIGFIDVLKFANVPFILVLYFLIFLAFNFFYVAFPIHSVQTLNWGLLKLGVFFSLIGLVLVIVQGPVLSKISSKYSEGTLIIAGSVLLGLSFFLFTSSNDLVIFIAVLLFSGGNGIMWPSFLSLLSKIAGNKYQGTIQGYASSTGSLASIIGLISGGILYGFIGVATFWIPGILMLSIFALSFKLLIIENNPTEIDA